MDSDSQPEFESPASQPEYSDGADMEKSSDSDNSDIADANVVEASLASDPTTESVETSVVEAELADSVDPESTSQPLVQQKAVTGSGPPKISANMDNVSAIGGAVGALVLGFWSLIGAFITNWSIINAVLGLLLGFWGLTSYRRKMAWVGIVLCLISMFLSLIQVSDIVNTYMNPMEENPL